MFSFSPLPSPEAMATPGALQSEALRYVSQYPALEAYYNSLPAPEALVPDVFERVINGLTTRLPRPEARPILASQLRQSPVAPQPEKPIEKQAEPKPTAQQAPKPEPEAEPKPEEGKDAKPSKPPVTEEPELPYLTKERLLKWQRQLDSGLQDDRFKAATDISTFLSRHPAETLSLQDRQACAALIIKQLNDPDVLIRQLGALQLHEGRIQFTRTESHMLPFRKLYPTLDKLLKPTNPAYQLEKTELDTLLSIKRNWKTLTNLNPNRNATPSAAGGLFNE